MHLRESIFSKFSGGACPRTPLVWACFARPYLPLHSMGLCTPPMLPTPLNSTVLQPLVSPHPQQLASLWSLSQCRDVVHHKACGNYLWKSESSPSILQAILFLVFSFLCLMGPELEVIAVFSSFLLLKYCSEQSCIRTTFICFIHRSATNRRNNFHW